MGDLVGGIVAAVMMGVVCLANHHLRRERGSVSTVVCMGMLQEHAQPTLAKDLSPPHTKDHLLHQAKWLLLNLFLQR